MTLVPHPWQLKGAAQGLLCCESMFKGFLLGDGMGVGKTLTAILMMHALKDKPGMSLVVCPAGVCHKWAATIDNSWRPVSLDSNFPPSQSLIMLGQRTEISFTQ